LIDLPSFVEAPQVQSSENNYRKRRKEYLIGGMIVSIKQITTKKQDKMAAFVFEDLESSVNCVLFPKGYEENKQHLEESKIVFLKCEIDDSRDELQLIVNKIIPFLEAKESLAKAFVISVENKTTIAKSLDSIKLALGESKGKCPVYIKIAGENKTAITLQLGTDFNIRPNTKLENTLKVILPEAKITYE
jgi:DNA polymerase III alpha subunit